MRALLLNNKILFYKFLVVFFYYCGDFLSKINNEFCFYYYQKFMHLSLYFDDIVGPYWFWKKVKK